MKNKCYSELLKFETFKERFNYLKLNGTVADFTFNGSRFLNQRFYKSDQWKVLRRRIILRDNGWDMGLFGYAIPGPIYIHHINPITKDDLVKMDYSKVFDPENLICLSFTTHNAIHYGDEESIPSELVTRTLNDTCPWR